MGRSTNLGLALRGRTASVALRRLFRLVWALLGAAPQVFGATSGIVINEIHYDPDVKTEPVEFIELFNSGSNTVNLAGWYFSDGINFTFPTGAQLGAGSYVVVAENPAAFQGKFGSSALGPWTGTLNNDGDKIVLRDTAGNVADEVDYQLGFPWPTVGDSPGYSIELVNPASDNNLGGNWRASVVGNPLQQTNVLIADHSSWKYFKGLSEASNPTTAWRALSFPDANWLTGNGVIGYGESSSFLSTILSDMRSNYTTVFFRKTFVVTNKAQITGLTLQAVYDDGFKVWINGSNVLNANISSSEVPYNATASSALENLSYITFTIGSAQSSLVNTTNIIAIQAANSSLSASSDFFLDVRLAATTGAPTHGPTPGARNSVYATNLPPTIRQVDHAPNQPTSGQSVVITARITDPEGVTNVTLRYQLVDPGNYIELTDAAYANNWTTLAMNDAGLNGDAQAGDSIYTVVLPASFQTNRRLVRYRISATDATGLSVTVPYADDPQPNFAYFVYNGVLAWTGAVQPGVSASFTVNSNEMNRLPVYQLIAKNNSVLTATGWNPGAPNNQYNGDNYLWLGTFVYDGHVYDHISFRMRGGVWRYAMGKNAWKFAFNRGHNFQARDDWGHKYNVPWRRLSFRPDIQQGDYLHRGEQGMFESLGYKLFRLAGVDAPLTTHIQFRIIDDAAEAPPGNQYGGDFWGLYLVVEEQDGRFLDERGLPDGNVYDMQGGTGTLNNIGPNGPLDKSDLNSFLSTYNNTNSTPTESWWRTNLNLPQYYSYQTILQGFHHYDIADGKNYFYYRNPVIGQWEVWPWDLDLSWADNMYRAGVSGGNEPFKSRVLSNFSSSPAYTALALEFRNRVREIRDLLFNTDQAYQVIDEMAALIRGPLNQPSIIDADRAQWDYNPVVIDTNIVNLSKAGQGRFYQWTEPVSKDFNGCVQLMKNYVVYRATSAAVASGVFGLDGLATDTIPITPTVSYIGYANYPLNRLSFRSSAYSGPYPFAAMKWRIGEITDTNAPGFDPNEPRPYEITAAWESSELTSFNSDIMIPASAVKIGHAYRVRVRTKDTSGRWSHWSAPVQFAATEPDNAAALVDNLRISELMYNPPGGSDFEFVELHNLSTNVTLELSGVNFTAGIDFTFTPGTTIPPDGYLLVVKAVDFAAFRAHYGLATNVLVTGPYTGSLANDGEKLELKTGAGGTEIFSFNYDTSRGWPVAASGAGHSLVPLDRATNGQASGALDYPGNWRASAFIGGSPGAADSPPPASTVVLNEITAHTDYSNPAKPEYDSNDWIELYNQSDTNVSLGGWFLSDDPADLRKWAIPAVSVPALGRLSYDEVTGFHTPITSGFGLDKSGEQVLLSYLPGTAADRVVDAIQFKGQENDFSLGRYPDGSGDWFTLLRTRDGQNTAPPRHVVINEIMYHPPDVGTNDNTLDEYLELLNPTAGTVNLFDTNGAWRIDGGVGFTFPSNQSLVAGGLALVVNFDPADPAALAAFRAKYGATSPGVKIFGPYSGKLGNRSDRVALEKPQYPDVPGGDYSWVIVDEVIYGNQSPWPSTADGTGNSLQRAVVNGYGNNSLNWFAAAPTAGQLSTTDRDGDGMPDEWELANQLDPDNATDAALDDDGDGYTNLQEYRAGTNPRDAASALKLTSVNAQGSGLRLQFNAMAGHSYTIQRRNDLTGGGWLKLQDFQASQTNGLQELTDWAPTNSPLRFYRLVTPSIP